MRPIGGLVAGLGLGLAAAVAGAQAPALVLDTAARDDARVGLKLRLFAGTVAVPHRRIKGDVIRGLHWFEGQVLRSWVVQSGAKDPMDRMRILLGEMRFPPNRAWMDGAWKPPATGDVSAGWTPQERGSWLATFAEMKPAPAAALKRPGGELPAFTFESKTHRGVGFVVARKDGPRPRTQLLLYKVPIKWDAARTDALARESAATLDLRAPDTAAAPARKLELADVPAPPAGAPSAERAATLARVQRSLAGHPGWWYLQTPHYLLVSNLDGKRDAAVIRELATKLERCHAAYVKLFPPKQNSSAVSVVKVFSHRDQLFAHFSERQPGAVNRGLQGMWIPQYDELVLSYDPAGKKLRPALTTLFHEGFHQYVYYAMGKFDIPRWFDEGTGDFFGGVRIDGATIRVGENPSRRNNITRIVNGEYQKRYKWTHPSLKTLVSMTRGEFYRQTKWLVFLYSMSWSLVYYLRKAVDEESPYHGLLDRYLDTLYATRDPAKAVAASFGKVDMARLEKDWKAFWLSPERRKTAEARPLLGK